MKRILPAIGTAFLACASQGAFAFDPDAALDQFPAAHSSAIDGVQEARRGARIEFGTGVREIGVGRERVSDHRSAGRYRTHGSFIEVSALGGSVEPGAFYGTAGTAHTAGPANAANIIVISSTTDLAALSAAIHDAMGNGARDGGPKVLDIETERLDRRPYGPDGLDVVHSGGAKIIRIGPDVGRAESREEEAPAPVAEARAEVPPATVYPDTDMAERPVDPPAEPRAAAQSAAEEPAAQERVPDERLAAVQAPPPPAVAPPLPAAAPRAETGSVLEPWTPEWLRDCVSRYPSFDASLGTYINDGGQRRFCTGEP